MRDRMSVDGRYVFLGDTVWPSPISIEREDRDDVEVAMLRGITTRTDEIHAARYVAAFRRLVAMPRRERDRLIARLRKVARWKR